MWSANRLSNSFASAKPFLNIKKLNEVAYRMRLMRSIVLAFHV